MLKKSVTALLVLSVLSASVPASARAGEIGSVDESASSAPVQMEPSREGKAVLEDLKNYDRLSDGEKLAVLQTLRAELDAFQERYSKIKNEELKSRDTDVLRTILSIGVGGATGFILVATILNPVTGPIWPLLVSLGASLGLDAWNTAVFAKQSSLAGHASEVKGQIDRLRREIDKKESELRAIMADRQGSKSLP